MADPIWDGVRPGHPLVMACSSALGSGALTHARTPFALRGQPGGSDRISNRAGAPRAGRPGRPVGPFDVSKDNPRIAAPGNFAADATGNPISVNAVGDESVKASRARGTTYDAATPRLRASTSVSPGRHILYMSIFDQGDRSYDSAVFIDRLTLNRRQPCESGAVKD
jgi:hypothetical protein